MQGEAEGKQATVAVCEYCGKAIPNCSRALYDGELWFCDKDCLRGSMYDDNQDGGVPA